MAVAYPYIDDLPGLPDLYLQQGLLVDSVLTPAATSPDVQHFAS